jgi:serine-type D-Ala-D-Ala carboxypeptidase (penicillin-binding protein 5/6)
VQEQVRAPRHAEPTQRRQPTHRPPPTRTPSVGVTEGLARLSRDPYRRPRGPSAKMRRRRLRTSLVVLVLLVLIGVLATGGGGSGGHRNASTTRTDATASHSHPSSPAYALSMSSKRVAPVPGAAPAIPWPSSGQAAVAVPSAGLLETSGAESPVSVASLTKMMTAYLTLEQHPLTATSQGPDIELTAADQQDYEEDTVSDASSVYVQAGEVLTERQLLTAMIVRSANNLADTFGRYDAGSIPAFVSEMNSEAQTLGMSSTHYVDTNGLDAGSVSTARDQLVLAETALQLPSFESIVDNSAVTLPYVGTLPNYVTAVGSDGVIGVKSGFTDAAGPCVVLAAMRQVGDQQVLVLADDLGQPDSLYYAQQEDLEMINAVAAGLKPVTVAGAHQVVGNLSVKAGAGAGESTKVFTQDPIVAVGWPGSTVTVYMRRDPSAHSVKADGEVGMLEVSSGGGTPQTVPVLAMKSIKS